MKGQLGNVSGEAWLESQVEQILALQPQLLRSINPPPPPELQARLGSVTPPQLEILGQLPKEGTPMRRFAEAMGISGAAATQMANRMIHQGLAQRRYDPRDRRTVSLAPTALGRELADALRAWRREAAEQLLQHLSEEQVAAFLEVIATISQPATTPAPKTPAV
ncbi:MAG: MarR family winged helix-turn-helix transcriptional regulator [Candidatus Dormibacteria bacterium]